MQKKTDGVIWLIVKMILLHFFIVIQTGNTICIFNIFPWTWTFSDGPTGNTSNEQKYDCFSKAFVGEDDFVVVLATFCFYYCGANGSESVEKIDTDQKEYHKSSLDVITNPPSIKKSKNYWLLGHLMHS